MAPSIQQHTSPQGVAVVAGGGARWGATALQKTKLCRFFAKSGFCFHGAACRFAHGEEQLNAKPDLSRTSICAYYAQRGTCLAGDRCKFAHGREQLKGPSTNPERNVQNGGRHGQAEPRGKIELHLETLQTQVCELQRRLALLQCAALVQCAGKASSESTSTGAGSTAATPRNSECESRDCPLPSGADWFGHIVPVSASNGTASWKGKRWSANGVAELGSHIAAGFRVVVKNTFLEVTPCSSELATPSRRSCSLPPSFRGQ